MFDAWEHVHAPALAAAAKPIRYAITTCEGREGRTPLAFDGIEELWFCDRAHCEQGMGEDAPKVQGDERFQAILDTSRCFRLVTTELISVDDAPTSRENEKVVLFVRRLDTVGPDHFFNEWRAIHSHNVAAGFKGKDGALRYVVTMADQNGERGAFDGFPVFWWRDAAARTAPADSATSGSDVTLDDHFDDLCAQGTLRLIGHEFYVVH
jgi:hypothetical protein